LRHCDVRLIGACFREHGIASLSPRLGIMIPALNEGPRLSALLVSLSELPCAAEILVVDGVSCDDTLTVARSQAGVSLVQRLPGRAVQMNVGAARARGEMLWFLHADRYIPAQHIKYATS
jgi:glycosyltransferase involved in cell wall biosynthesis